MNTPLILRPFRQVACALRVLIPGLGIQFTPACLPLAAQSVPAGPVVILDAAMVDVRTGDIRPNTTVIVDGRRIARVGPTATIHLPQGARIIDGRGKYLIPGLIDTHVHLFRPWRRNWPDTIAQLGWIVASGVTTVRDAGASGLEANYAALRAANDAGRIVAPRIRISGNVDRVRQLGLDQVKILPLRREDALKTIRETRATGLAVYGHTWEDYQDTFLESTSFSMAAVRAGISGLTHHRYRMAKDTLLPNSGPRLAYDSSPEQVLEAEIYAGAGWLSVDQRGLRALIDTMLVYGTWFEPTLGAGFPRVCTIPIDSMELRRYYPFNTDRARATATPSQEATIKRYCDARRQFVRQFYEAGVPLVTGSDSDPIPPRGVTEEMRLLVEAGIPALGALRAATINAARALEMDHDIGTIEDGKLADMVLLEDNPLTNIMNVRRVSAVVADGRIVDRTQLLARTGTTPPMTSFDDQLDRLDERLMALAFERPDSVVEVLVHTDGTMQPDDLRGIAPAGSPVTVVSVQGRVLRLRMPAFAARITSRIRFVVRIELANSGNGRNP